jgi:hypothetical protein
MKKIIIPFLFILISFSAFTQNNKILDPYDILLKVLNYDKWETSKNLIFSGGSRVGLARGESFFDFSNSKKSFPNVIVTYTAFLPGKVLKEREGGRLDNLKFSNTDGGGYKTKSIIGDWVNFDKGYGSGKFKLSIDGEQNPNMIEITIRGNGFLYFIKIEVEESDKFQELVNILTISGKPLDVKEANKSYELIKSEKELKIQHDFEKKQKEEQAIKQAILDKEKVEELQKIKEEAIKKKDNDSIYVASIVGNTITLKNLIIAQNDFAEPMIWEAATEVCKNLGEGWRLPDIDELKYLYTNKNLIGGFSNGIYWSSSESDKGNYHKYISFNNGNQFDYIREYDLYHVRAVKSLKSSSNSIIGKTIKIDNLEVAEKDFPNKMNWDDAKKACESLGNGWRLPSKSELKKIFKIIYNKTNNGSFFDGYYWSSTEVDDDKAWAQARPIFQFANNKSGLSYVRAVRDF